MKPACDPCRVPSARLPEGGFSLVEVVVALTLVLVILGGLFSLSAPTTALHRSLPEIALVQQRLRYAFERLHRDLLAVGRGTRVQSPGPLARILPPVLPYRLGLRAPPAPHRQAGGGALTVLRVSATGGAETVTTTPLAGPRPMLTLAAGPGCGPPVCGYAARDLLLVFDDRGHHPVWDFFRVIAVRQMTLMLERLRPGGSTTFAPGAVVAPLSLDHYYYDPARTELRHYDGWRGDFPLVDNVVAFEVRLLGVTSAGGDPCVASFGGQGAALVEIETTTLTDGPWCGPPALPFDADLRRLRAVTVELRVQSGDAMLRGADPQLFARPGSAPSGRAWVPDHAVTFTVTPPNLASR